MVLNFYSNLFDFSAFLILHILILLLNMLSNFQDPKWTWEAPYNCDCFRRLHSYKIIRSFFIYKRPKVIFS